MTKLNAQEREVLNKVLREATDRALGPSALRKRIAELEEALGWFVSDERFQVMVGGNPNAVEKMMSDARRIYEGRDAA